MARLRVAWRRWRWAVYLAIAMWSLFRGESAGSFLFAFLAGIELEEHFPTPKRSRGPAR